MKMMEAKEEHLQNMLQIHPPPLLVGSSFTHGSCYLAVKNLQLHSNLRERLEVLYSKEEDRTLEICQIPEIMLYFFRHIQFCVNTPRFFFFFSVNTLR